MEIGKISNRWIITKFANFQSKILVFQIVKFRIFVNFPIWKIPKISQIFLYWQIHEIIKFMKLLDFENKKILKILQFGKLKILKISSLINYHIFRVVE